MATNTLQDGGVDNLWSTAGNWDLGHKPLNTEDLVMNVSMDVTLDEGGVGVSLDMTGYTGTLSMGANGLDIGGDVTLDGRVEGSGTINCAGSFALGNNATIDLFPLIMDAGTGSLTIDMNGNQTGDLTIDDGGGNADFNLLNDWGGSNNFVLNDGIFNTGGFTMDSTGTLSGFGGEIAFGTSSIQFDSNISLTAIAATSGAGVNFATNGTFNIGAGGSFTPAVDWVLNGNFLVDGGTMTGAGGVMLLNGNCTWTSGSATNFIRRFVGDGTLKWNYQNGGGVIIDAGVTVTLTGNSRWKSISGDGTLDVGAYTWNSNASGLPNNFWALTTDVVSNGGSIRIDYDADISNALCIKAGAANVITNGRTDTKTLTLTGGLDTSGTYTAKAHTSGHLVNVIMDGLLTNAAVVLGGGAGGDDSASLTLNNHTNSIASFASGHDDNLANAIDLANSMLILSGTFNGNNDGANPVDCKNTAGAIIGGTVTKATFDNNVNHLVIAAVDSNNTKVTEMVGTPGTWMPQSRSMQVRNYDQSIMARSW